MTNSLDRFFWRVIAASTAIITLMLGLTGCAINPVAPPASTLVWHDALFDWSPGRVTVTSQDLFNLEPALVKQLSDPALKKLSNAKRLEYVMNLLYGQQMRRFDYSAGHSTTAAQTWGERRGDCLSLTVLVYAMGHQLGMSPDKQAQLFWKLLF